MYLKALCTQYLANSRLSSHPFCNWKLLLPEVVIYVLSCVISTSSSNPSVLIIYRCMLGLR